MKIFLIFLLVAGSVSAGVDLKRSVTRISDQILRTKTSEFDWQGFSDSIKNLLGCLNNLSLFGIASSEFPASAKNYIETLTPKKIAEELVLVDWTGVSAKIAPKCEFNADADLTEFMKKTEFLDVHNMLWNNTEFLDLVGFLHDADYSNIYVKIKEFYENHGREDLSLQIPDAPPPSKLTTRTASNPKRLGRSNNLDLISVKSFNFLKEDDPSCNIMDLLGLINDFNKTNVQEIIKIFLYAFQEFIGNAAIHILLLKAGEPQKGKFFQEFLNNENVKQEFGLINRLVLEIDEICQLNGILKHVTGLTLEDTELFSYIVNLIGYLVWNQPFPENA